MQNQIPKNWQNVRVGEIADIFDSLHETPAYDDKGYPMVRVTDIKPGFLKLDSCLKVSESIYQKFSKKHKAELGDIVFSRVGSEGISSLVKDKIEFCLGQNTVFIVPKNSNNFLYYWLNSFLGKAGIKSKTTGSSQNTISLESIKDLNIEIPPVPQQEEISVILSAFDDKVEVNNKIAKTLEEMAQILFKKWFIYPQYPLGKLSDIAKITMGQSPSSKFYNKSSEGLPFHQGVTNFGNRFPKHEIYCTENNRVAEKEDILFSVRAPVGRLNIADTKLSLGRGVAGIRHKQGYQSYLYYFLRRMFRKEDSLGGGSVFPAVTKDDMEGMEVLIPEEKLIKRFEDIVSNMDQRIEFIEKENQKLAALRDLLLPKLMRGEIRV